MRIYMQRDYHDHRGKHFTEKTFYKFEDFEKAQLDALVQGNYALIVEGTVEDVIDAEIEKSKKKAGRPKKYETREMTAK
jgi:hypothetical protein